MYLTARASFAPGSRSAGMIRSQMASTVWPSSAVKKRQGLAPWLAPPEMADPATAAEKPAWRNCRREFGIGPPLPSGMRENAVNDFGVLADLVLDSGKHAHVNPVDGLDAFESGAEGLLDAALGDASGGQNLESKAGFPGLPHYPIHARRIALHVDVAGHLHHLAVQCLLPLVHGAPPVIDAAGVEIDIPVLLLHLRDDLGDVCAHSDQDTQIAHLLAPLLDASHVAVLVGGIDHFALPLQPQRLEGLYQHFHVDPGGHLGNEVHLTALGPPPRPVLRPPIQVDVVEGIDTEAAGLVQHIADFILGVPFLHDRAEVVVVMGKAVEGVDAQDHAADFRAA